MSSGVDWILDKIGINRLPVDSHCRHLLPTIYQGTTMECHSLDLVQRDWLRFSLFHYKHDSNWNREKWAATVALS